ncbi:hypothetical protein [Mycobacterium sp. OTB74]|jgi:hypothetical protein|uniref:hypothetical protein n=1 Tax=Mycobacterium sp. OTB74 TaxID=1853452 RepID=UPI002475B63A|nr:hypothetical protein [Mycobacterium sp. OTB74]MDH6244941.1 hypothetical protein [Mycobacterium sp. OTB74]
MRITIDPNIRIENNWTYVGFGDVFGNVDELSPGDWVTAMWEETDQIADAMVMCIDYERKLVDLAVDWPSFRKDPSRGLSVDWSSFRKDEEPKIVGSLTSDSADRREE